MALTSAGPASSTWRIKKLLASAMVLGACGSITVSGAYGLLNSEGSHRGSLVASGTLTFTNVVNTTGTTCYSYNGAGSSGNVNGACQALFTAATENFPGAAATANVTLANNGSLDAAGLSVYMPSCTATTTPGAPSPGGANPCAASGAQFYVQEADAAGTATKCWFPSGAGACVFAANSLFVFQTNDNAPATALDLGAGPVHAQSRYFAIGMRLASNASNALQGQAALFSLRWHVTS